MIRDGLKFGSLAGLYFMILPSISYMDAKFVDLWVHKLLSISYVHCLSDCS